MPPRVVRLGFSSFRLAGAGYVSAACLRRGGACPALQFRVSGPSIEAVGATIGRPHQFHAAIATRSGNIGAICDRPSPFHFPSRRITGNHWSPLLVRISATNSGFPSRGSSREAGDEVNLPLKSPRFCPFPQKTNHLRSLPTAAQVVPFYPSISCKALPSASRAQRSSPAAFPSAFFFSSNACCQHSCTLRYVAASSVSPCLSKNCQAYHFSAA